MVEQAEGITAPSGFDVTGALPAVAAGDPLPDEHSARTKQIPAPHRVR
jgi:hypothetical protein